MAGTLTGLKVVDLLGVFYREGGRLMVADEIDGTRCVDEELSRYEGVEVRVLAHHRPAEPHDPARWGGGCCLLQASGACHFGHHEDATRLYTFNGVGILRAEGPQWLLAGASGDDELLVGMLEGHRSQIVLTTIPNLEGIDEKIRSFDPSTLEGATLEELTEKLTEMRDFLAEVDRLKNDING